MPLLRGKLKTRCWFPGQDKIPRAADTHSARGNDSAVKLYFLNQQIDSFIEKNLQKF